MGLLVFMRNLLLALCLFLVLGFLYYSAWKLHLLRWEDSNSVVLSFDSVGHTIGSGRRERKTVAIALPLSIPSHLAADPGKDRAQKEPKETMAAPGPAIPKYDKLGFLLNLDSKLPPELASKYANFSEGTCKPGYASALMTVIFPKFSKPAPMFLDDSFRKWARIRDFVPPFGIKGQDNLIKAILSATKDYRLTPALDSLSCRRCIIVGNGGVLANKSLGLKIDDYDVVVRLNSAPVKGFEKDVGGKTTLRITYPEGAIQKMEQYEKDSLFVLAGFKWQDFKWLKYIVYKEKVSASDGFWKSVATRVPREPHEIRILNPYFIQEAAFSFIGLPFNNGLMGRGSWTHNIQREKEFLRKLVKARVITDLTSGFGVAAATASKGGDKDARCSSRSRHWQPPRKKPTSLKTHRDAQVLWEDPLTLPVCTRVASAASRPRAGRRWARD
ncbi:PREDICTED: CMP-N-acetylneuraminate-beta-1,4-galactoside alpha-2,3-sialyltransferase isoform X3 [Pygoscelis adeliae]|uniref:CMP-N-acetylneuraminate-beta-1,4-galactoside alpha-2,3-sialyltransferase isoform X3 n=1 Tax=Pygoscelis adeliae TaxID=9238 RepID=UPI0004F50AEE|nr:PREDICTED: CMP-N-acetylneuraminate-beta-1,4-galactoside alpha-2,3-sialyltransferase isoform X3 [Pygoscelis adeliae]